MPAKTNKPVPKSIRKKPAAPDFSVFPPESVTHSVKTICLACVLDVFTRHMGMALTAAHREIRRYVPPLAELNAAQSTRPYLSDEGPCTYCGAASKWQARLEIHRIESGKATDLLRRQLLKSLPTSTAQFAVLEEKATKQHAYFEWLEKVSEGLDLDDPISLRDISMHYLSRKEPKVNWREQFLKIHGIRRSRRLDTGWEVEGGRLFLTPLLFDELLLVQYLISRSHKGGGLTLEGRYTLPELFARLRNAGYLRAVGVQAGNSGDALEQLLEHLSGGQASLKFYYVVDRRDFLERAKTLSALSPPRPKRSWTAPGR